MRHRVIDSGPAGLFTMAPNLIALTSFDSRVHRSLHSLACRQRNRRLDVFAIAAAALVNERYLSRRFTITELARELRVSPLTLRLRFRRFYGLALDEHLALRRLELATVLMSHAPHRVGALDDIARRSGYSDVSALDRDFVRYRRTPALAAWFRMGSTRSESGDGPA